jgi:hypothetical protein
MSGEVNDNDYGSAPLWSSNSIWMAQTNWLMQVRARLPTTPIVVLALACYGTGNTDMYLSSNGVHPIDLGAKHIAARVADSLEGIFGHPQPQSVSVPGNQFGFTIAGSSNLLVLVEACTNLANPIWSPIHTIASGGGPFYFSDSQWTNYPNRFYHLTSP